jgi:ParB family chromosome partitioning protein
MATEEFLSCLSRGALEKAARAEGVRVEPRARDTRQRMVTRFKDGTFVHPAALFRVTPEELAAARAPRPAGGGWVAPPAGDDDTADGTDAPEAVDADELDADELDADELDADELDADELDADELDANELDGGEESEALAA